MRTILIMLAFATSAALVSCSKPTANALSFYVVSEKPVANGHYVNTPSFPKLGYISSTPSFILTRLEEVYTNDVTHVSTMLSVDSTPEVVTTNTIPAVSIRMYSEDSKSFAAFTGQNIGRQLLLMVGDQPLMAPRVVAPIETGTLELGWQKQRFPKAIVERIQKLAHRE
jgi:preprotein translocase subunit SecD